jgi:prenyltransferase beta subunit
MRTRRQVFTRGVGAFLGLVLCGLIFAAQQNPEPVPDGSASRGMITRSAQEAIDQSLAYLANNQHADGSFGTHQHRGNVAITSLGGLAFMAAGHQPGRGRYGQNVQRALQFVMEQERQDVAGFLHNKNAILHGPMYGHGFGTLFLAEAHGMVHNREQREKLRATLSRAVDLIIKTQNVEGGWRYQPTKADADISVTICQINALRAARNAGFAVPKSVAEHCTRYVKSCQDMNDGGGFRYQPLNVQRNGHTGFARTAAGVVALHSAGVYKGTEVEKGLEYLLQRCKPGQMQHQNRFDRHDMSLHYYYGHYYAVQAMWTAGGKYWTEWYPAIRDELLNHRDRERDGSWFDRRICPHYSTAMASIILQVPNNYLPILQR